MKKTIIKSSEPQRKSRPALTPEARENQIISKAYNLAERQIEEGTASSQVITYFLKAGAVKEQLELEKIRRENILLEKKAEAVESGKKMEELYNQAIEAFKDYKGQ